MPNMDFREIPSFVCIKSVYMRQIWPQIIRLLPLLKQFSGNFSNSLKFHLNALIGFDYDNFNCSKSFDEFFKSSAEFAWCLRRMLEIFERCSPQFTFCVNGPQRQHITFTLPLIAATLELPSVQASDNVHLLLPNNGYYGYCSWVLQLSIQNQVKVISDWLHRPYVSGGNHRSEYIRSLTSTEREHMLRSNIRELRQAID